MDASRFDSVSRLLARRRLSRRQALRQGGAGLVAATGLGTAGLDPVVAQEATPAPEPAPSDGGPPGPEMLFLQSFQSGSIVPKDGVDGRYTVTLEHGLGQTIYFSDRPDRIVGTSPTPQFLAGLGFPPDNPPNAALVMETAAGETDIAVVELFHPVYDEASHTVTYEVAVLENWEDSTQLGFADAPSDLAALAPTFGAAHLFIDGCPTDDIECYVRNPDLTLVGTIANHDFGGFCFSHEDIICVPCSPFYSEPEEVVAYWSKRCTDRFSRCNGACEAHNVYRFAD